MPAFEFASWMVYFKHFPFDDHSRYHRPAALIASGVLMEPLDALLDWLAKKPPKESAWSQADLATFKALGVKPPKE